MNLALYRAALFALWPGVRLYLAVRLRRGKEDAERFGERLGNPSLPRPAGRLVWLHAASVGESLSLLPLIDALRTRRPALSILVTTGTVTSAKLLAERLPKGVLHQYVPVDRLASVRRFLDHWRPDLVLWAESEFWPNLVSEPARRKIPMVLVNGRVSPRSFKGWRRAPSLIKELLAGFSLCLGQSEADAQRLKELGAPQARSVGNLKFAAPPLPAEATELAMLQKAFGTRPRWLAASTHPGEEEIAARIHRRLAPTQAGLLTVIAPRHPERGAEIARSLAQQGLKVARRARGEPIDAATEVYLADTLGELGLFFRLCDLVFMGKSLAGIGGQNPLEPARLGCAILHGPHVENFADITDRMDRARASRAVAGEEALADAASRLLSNPGERRRLGEAACVFASAEDDVLAATLEALAPFLDALAPEERSLARA